MGNGDCLRLKFIAYARMVATGKNNAGELETEQHKG